MRTLSVSPFFTGVKTVIVYMQNYLNGIGLPKKIALHNNFNLLIIK